MVSGFVAILALKIHTLVINTHVDVEMPGWFLQFGTHIAVFNRVATAAQKMAVHAAGGTAGPSHILGHLDKIHVLFGKPRAGRCFFIGTGRIVTYKAIDIVHQLDDGLIEKIEGILDNKPPAPHDWRG